MLFIAKVRLLFNGENSSSEFEACVAMVNAGVCLRLTKVLCCLVIWSAVKTTFFNIFKCFGNISQRFMIELYAPKFSSSFIMCVP